MSPPATEGWVRGVYLQDGLNLWWIARVDTYRGTVLLENARHPDMPLIEVPVHMLVADGYRLVDKRLP